MPIIYARNPSILLSILTLAYKAIPFQFSPYRYWIDWHVWLIFGLQTERWINLKEMIDFCEWKIINKNHDMFVIYQ